MKVAMGKDVMSFGEVIDTMNEITFFNQDILQSSLAWIFADLTVYPQVLASLNLPPVGQMMDKAGLEGEYSDIHNLVLESARVHPCFPHHTSEVTSEDFKFKGHMIPKGTSVSVDLFSLNHNANYWSQPDKFLLERWNNLDEFVSKWGMFRQVPVFT